MNLLGTSGRAHLAAGAEAAAGLATGDVDGNQSHLGVCGTPTKRTSNGKVRIGDHE
jgi:hypothetical protein